MPEIMRRTVFNGRFFSYSFVSHISMPAPRFLPGRDTKPNFS
jgi:hypothetical protein